MHATLRTKNRWFSATMALACLAGVTMEGCTRTNRDMTASVSEKAAQEALNAERHSAERRRLESTSTRSKEVVAKKTAPVEAPEKSPSLKREPLDSDEAIASNEELRPSSQKVVIEDDLETADWAGEYLDRRVQAVADSRLEEDSSEVEPLLDERDEVRSAETAVDVWSSPDDEAVVRVSKKPAAVVDAQEPANDRSRGAASHAGEHPWASKAPAVASAARTTSSTQARTVSRSAVPSQSAHRAVPPNVDPVAQMQDKATIQTMLNKGHDLVDQGELRRAYTVVQMAQRMAESKNVFFAAGEEQPSDLIRSIQLKVRSGSPDSAMAQQSRHPSSRTSAKIATPASGRQTRVFRNDIPEDWNFAEWQQASDGPSRETDPHEPAVNEGLVRMTAEAVPQRKSPHSSRTAGGAFPALPTEWASESAKTALQVPGEFPEDQIAQGPAVQPANASSADSPFAAEESTSSMVDGRPSQTGSDSELALADWRTQSLENVTGTRQPLLVAPLPSTIEELAPPPPALDNDILAVDLSAESTDEPSKSKLWMVLAAAAGLLLVLLTRRRPALARTSAPLGTTNHAP
ncbi:MAG: hypothetical protein DWH91_13590 [Planctomycetota bacterium]|nr:MAG: hypothetical protein DWH91_13590 [Planctomycetota bacterium]